MKNIKELLEAPVTRVTLIGALGVGALTACGPDYASHGNEFKVEGRVSSVGERSVSLNETRIIDAHGKAVEYMKDNGHDRIHDNYNICSFTDSRKHVGHVFNGNGQVESLKDLRPGEEVVITGSVHDNADYCGKNPTYSERGVYDTVQELPQ